MSLKTVSIALVMAATGLLAAGAAQAHDRHVPARYQPAHVVHVPARTVVVVDHRHSPRAAVRHGVYAGDRLSQRDLVRASQLNWRRQGLRAPGHGQMWVRLDGQRLLLSGARVVRVA